MARITGIGLQDFEKIRRQNIFLVDKTEFIKEWWENRDDVTLITRPRRFGKTLTISMVEKFFSPEYKGTDIFEGMDIWKYEEYRKLQGTYPVISLSFSSIKETSYEEVKRKICKLIQLLYRRYGFLLKEDFLEPGEKEDFLHISADMEEYEASLSLQQLSGYLYRYYGKKVILLLDEYDTPMQEAYAGGYWKELTGFVRSLFNASFKDNSYLERGIMTGITRVSKESIFSDLNNLEVVTSTSLKYRDKFGFTEKEVEKALVEYDLEDRKEEVKRWYDGFCFGGWQGIYNPWSIINFLDKKEVGPYWTNTSSNTLIGKILQKGTRQIKETFEKLLEGETIKAEIDEQIVYEQLDLDENAVWSLMLASGYLKVAGVETGTETYTQWKKSYLLSVTNFEVAVMLRGLVKSWFASAASNYNSFIRALIQDDIEAMNVYMNRVALATFSYFDSSASEEKEPERFYHGFVLGLMVDLEDRYVITSNRESGFGRYDVMLEPRNRKDPAVLIEFKVQSPREKSLSDTAREALRQIDEKGYDADLRLKGFLPEQIRKYGFAFRGKQVLIEKEEGAS